MLKIIQEEPLTGRNVLPKLDRTLGYSRLSIQKPGTSPDPDPEAKLLGEILSTSIQKMSEYESATEHLKFLNAEKISIKIVPNGALLDSSLIAVSHPPRNISLSQEVLKEIVRDLKAKGNTEAEIKEIASSNLVPVLVHELRHLINVKSLKDLGINWSIGSVEEEAWAFRDQGMATGEMLRKSRLSEESTANQSKKFVPELSSNFKSYVAVMGGADALKALARDQGSGIELTGATLEQTIKRFKQVVEYVNAEGEFETIKNDLTKAAEKLDSNEISELLKKLYASRFFPKINSREMRADILKTARAGLTFLEEVSKDVAAGKPNKFVQLQNFYSQKP